MKNFIKIFFIFIFFVIFGNSALAENFYIENYDIKINVNETNKLNINENIHTNFVIPSHGIFRTIPTKYKLQREDGSVQKVNAKVKNIKASYYNSKSYVTGQNTYLKIKMGDADRLITGKKDYNISFDYILPTDNIKDSDELYFNIIGTDWNTNINNASFEINMPKPFNNEMVGFSIGGKGSTGYNIEDLSYKIDGNRITGKINRPLNANEGVTVRIILPEGYFITQDHSYERNLTIAGIFFLTFVSFIIWLIYGKDEKVIPVVNFYPPKKENSAQVGLEFRGKADIKEVVSLIVYLANKGYIEIEEDGKSFIIKKKKEYDGKNNAERLMVDAIFKHGNAVLKEELEVSTTFYKDCQNIIKYLNGKYRVNIFDKNAVTPAKVAIMAGSLLGIIILVLFSLNDYDFSFSQNLFPCVFLSLFIGIPLFILIREYTKTGSNIMEKLTATIWFCCFTWPLVFTFLDNGKNIFSNYDPYIIIAGLSSIIISIICLVNLPKRNYRGRRILGDILGFKQFLNVAEKHRIEMLVNENPNYCYDVLPYAYVLGVSDKWISNFESIIKEPPEWYKGQIHSGRGFYHSFNDFTNSVAKLSVPSTANGGISRSSGSGFSGGGFSGGGHGGGGGGSW